MFTSTRGLLVLTLLCSAVFGYRAYKVERYLASVQALKDRGVHLGDEYPDYFGPDVVWDYIYYDLLGKRCGIHVELPDYLRLWTYTWVIMRTPGVPDDVAAHLGNLHGVNRLDIRSNSPNAEPAENLCQIRVTDNVTLTGPWIDEVVIRAATKIPGLPRGGEWWGGLFISAANDELSEELQEYLKECPIEVHVWKWKK